jgi:DNA-binding NarL/FixJ family response regulator
LIRVLIVEDRRAARDGLKRLLAKSGEVLVVAEAASAVEAGELASRAECDLAVLGLPLSSGAGIERLRDLRLACPGMRILAVGQPGEPAFAAELRNQGAAGYLEMGRAAADLVNAVRLVCRGGSFVSAPLPGPGSRTPPRAPG